MGPEDLAYYGVQDGEHMHLRIHAQGCTTTFEVGSSATMSERRL
jgi:hypothetical protein